MKNEVALKILLIQSSYLKPNGKVYKTITPSTISFSLPLLAALTPGGAEVEIVDDVLEEIPFTGGHDLVGITAMTFQAPRAYQIADRFRGLGKKVVMGGFHATFFPEDALRHCDSVVIGDAEQVWPQLVEDFLHKNLKPRYQSASFHSLQGLPPPRYDLIEMKLYRAVPIQATRGCAYECDFCWVQRFYRRTYRKRPVKEVVRDIQSYRGDVKRFFFVDDNLMLDKEYAKELFRALVPLQIEWLGQSDISIAQDNELLHLCKESGCIFLFIGVESLDPSDLESMGKSRIDIERISEDLEKIRKRGIPFCLSFVFGFDGTTRESFHRTVRFAIRSRAHYFIAFKCFPVPRSRLDQRLQREKRYIPEQRKDWASYSGLTLQFVPKNVGLQDFDREFRKSLKDFYSCRSILSRTILYPIRFRHGSDSLKHNFWHIIVNVYMKIRISFGSFPLTSV